jgi:hypothetical protein
MRLGPFALTTALMLSSPASAQIHPNETIYRYRVKDYALQSPFASYPEGKDAREWDCYNEKTGRAIDCSLATGPLSSFRYIFRLRYLDGPRFGGRGLF